jgi:hypothetical protein
MGGGSTHGRGEATGTADASAALFQGRPDDVGDGLQEVGALQSKVEAQGLVEVGAHLWRQGADERSDAFNGNRSDLFCLGFGVSIESGVR